MLSLGAQESDSSMIQMDQDTALNFSDTNLSTSLFQLGKRIGARFAKKNGKDVALYQAEALYVLTLICRDEEFRQDVVDERTLIRKVYRELYNYMYADRVVAASRMTVWRQEKSGDHVVTTESPKEIVLADKKCSEIDLMILFDEVARTTHEKEYLMLRLEGKDEMEIGQHLHVCERIVNDIRARIVKRLKQRNC